MRRYLWLLVLFAFLTVAGVALWRYSAKETESQSGPAVTRITIGTFSKALGNTPYHVAKSRGQFQEHPALRGIEIRHVEYNDRPAIAQAFDKGELQVLFSAEIPAILCYAQGNDIRIVEISGVAAQEIVVPVHSSIQSVGDLRGKKLAVLPGTSSHYCLLKVLRQHGLQTSDLEISYMSPGEAKVAFETGRLPAWAVWAPWVEQVEVTGLGRPIEDSQADIASVMTLSGPFLLDHPNLARALVEVVQESKNWVNDNTVEAQEIAAKDLNLDIAVVRQAWPKFDWTTRLSPEVIPDFQDKAAFLASDEKTRLDREVQIPDLLRFDL